VRTPCPLCDARPCTVTLTGTVDRIDEAPSGGLLVVDYKTGRTPPPSRMADAFFQLDMYALLLAQMGGAPATLRLLFLGDGAVRDKAVDEPLLAHTAETLRRTWARVLAAVRADSFEPSVGPLCEWCAHRAVCPAMSDASREADDAVGEADAWPPATRRQRRARRRARGG
jgi:putative RecB family exonuclease